MQIVPVRAELYKQLNLIKQKIRRLKQESGAALFAVESQNRRRFP